MARPGSATHGSTILLALAPACTDGDFDVVCADMAKPVMLLGFAVE